MPIEIRCQCGKKLRVPDKLAGRMVNCPGCNAQLQVPALAALDDDDYEDDVPPAPKQSAFGSPPQLSAPRNNRQPPQDDQRYSLREFVEETGQKDHGQGFFELEIAITSHFQPMTLRVTPDQPVTTDPNATIAWSGNLVPEFRKDISLKTFFGRGSGESIQMHFRGHGFVVVQPYEELYFQSK